MSWRVEMGDDDGLPLPQPIGQAAKDVVDSDPSNVASRPGKTSTTVSLLHKPSTWVAAGVLVAAAIVVGVTVGASSGSSKARGVAAKSTTSHGGAGLFAGYTCGAQTTLFDNTNADDVDD